MLWDLQPLTAAAALALWRKAEASHRRADWRMATRALASIVEAMDAPTPRKAAEPVPARPGASSAAGGGSRPLSLIEFLATIGGVCDPGGELANLDPDKDAYARIRRRRDAKGRLLPKLIQPEGMTLATATERAWEAGFFPRFPMPRQCDNPDDFATPDSNDLLEAIDRELRTVARDDEPDDYPYPDEDEVWLEDNAGREAWQ